MVNVVQSTYPARIDAARAGMIAGEDFNSRTGIVEAAAGIGFGLAVSQGVGDQGVVLGGASKFLGITIRDITLAASVTPDVYPQYANVGYVSRGQIWVVPNANVAVGDAVTYDSTTGRLSNTGGVSIPGARWCDTALAQGFARVELLANAGS